MLIISLIDINGGYTAWSQWSACDKKCGSGFKHRKRSCTNPIPSGKGKDCSSLGSAAQKMACKIKDCNSEYKAVLSVSIKSTMIIFTSSVPSCSTISTRGIGFRFIDMKVFF